ncbi:MAG TPA: hypothetical protein VIH89_13595 [Candidatus Sulfotelmatobacter sp.]
MRTRSMRTGLCTAALLAAALLFAVSGWAQDGVYERSFPQPKAAVEQALRQMQPSMSGRLPVLEGFAAPGDHPLNSYRRGFYQVTAQVNSTASGGTVVRLTTKITAWYADSAAAHSGYQLLTSNGRLEADLLDQLSDQLALPQAAAKAPDQPRSVRSAPATSNTDAANQKASAPEPALSAPMPRLPDTGGIFSSSLSENLSANSRADTQKSQSALADADFKLQAEAASLEEVLKNQAHPKNLVAVKKSGTAVVSTPSLTAKTLFLASTHDEFEMLNFNRDWVHVRISGLSRGWIWRDSVELPDSVPDSDTPSNPAISPAAELFHVSREETAVFPGDWEPLKGKSVKIVSVEKADENAKDDSSQLKLAFAKSLLDQNYNELAKKADLLSGIVLIFDSSDGGMIAATFSTLQQWKAGRLSDSALWHQCFFDPPETFVPSGSPGSK